MTTELNLRLFEALRAHDLTQVRLALARGADPNAVDPEGWRPLHVIIGDEDALGFVKILLDAGADPNAWDLHHNETPLLLASDPPDVPVARALLEAGADPNARRSEGESPLRLAARDKCLELAALLLRHGAAKTIDIFGGLVAWTALGHAAENFDVPMIRLLLNAGADPETSDGNGDTARDKLPPRETQDPQVWDDVIELLGRRREHG